MANLKCNTFIFSSLVNFYLILSNNYGFLQIFSSLILNYFGYNDMSKIVKEDCLVLSMSDLKRFGYLYGHFSSQLSWTGSFSDKKNRINFDINTLNYGDMYIELNYTSRDQQTWKNHEINRRYEIIRSQCNYGGERFWFVCKGLGVYCGRRVSKLYASGRTHYFACRHCNSLTYRSRLDGFSYSMPDIKEYGLSIKRWYYRGQPTKKHMQYKKREDSCWRPLMLKYRGKFDD